MLLKWVQQIRGQASFVDSYSFFYLVKPKVYREVAFRFDCLEFYDDIC